MIYTTHAIDRCKQRAIPLEVVQLILSLGEGVDSGGGAKIYALLSKIEKAEFVFELKAIGMKPKEKWSNIYLVITSDQVIITAGYRRKRIKEAYRTWH